MDFSKQYEVGEDIKIFLMKDSELFFTGKILEMNYENKILIIGFSDRVLCAGDIISIKKEYGEHIFIFNSKVLKVIEGHKILLKWPAEENRMNKKEFYKLPLCLDIEINSNDNKKYYGKTEEISNNGILLTMDKLFKVGENIKLTIPLQNELILKNVSVLVKDIEKGKCMPYRYYVSFEEAEEIVREKILAYIFRVQRILLQISKNM